MKFINHRVNSLSDLKKIPLENGAELDIRYHNNDLILDHDPFHHHETKPETLENLLKQWTNKGTIILNIKTEGIEKKCIEMMNKYRIDNWFFLDLSMPYFVLYAEIAKQGTLDGFGPDNLAVRFSEQEPIEYALSFKGNVGWTWIDCFTHLPINEQNYSELKKAGFKICLVSPELQKHPLDRISEFKKQIINLEIDAVCTKRPDLWQ